MTGEAVDEHVRASLIKTHGNLYRGARLTRYPIPPFPLADGRGARSARPRLQLGALDDRRRPGRLAGDGDRSARRSRSVRRGGSRSSSASRPSTSSATRASFRSPDASFDAVFSYSVLQHLAKEDVRARGRRDPPGAAARRAGLDRDAERARPAQPRPPGRDAASPRAPGRTSATGRCGELRETFGAIGPVVALGRRVPDDQPAAGRPRPAARRARGGRPRLRRAAPGLGARPRSSSRSPTAWSCTPQTPA